MVATDVRVFPAIIHEPAGSLVTRRAILKLELSGLQISPGHRLGDVVKAPRTEEIKDTETASAKVAGSVEAAFAAGSASQPEVSAKVTAEAGGSIEKRRERSSTAIVEHAAVKAKGGNLWEIYDGGADLAAVYIQAESTLCHLERLGGSNRAAVTIEGYVCRRDLDFKPEKRFPPVINKEKVILAILASGLGTGVPGPMVKLSSQEFSDD